MLPNVTTVKTPNREFSMASVENMSFSPIISLVLHNTSILEVGSVMLLEAA